MIDPGSKNSSKIEKTVGKKEVDYIFLTHEHFDHIWCADKIRQKYNAKLCCHFDAAEAITNNKKNMSLFYNQTGFELAPPDILLNDRQIINWKGMEIEIIHTPGHTNGCICIKIENNLFTGDTIIKNVPTITKLPGGSKTKQQKSMEKLVKMGFSNYNLFYGHGKNDSKE